MHLRSMKAMSMGKNSLKSTSSYDDTAESDTEIIRASENTPEIEASILVPEAINFDVDDSPICPTLSKYSMQLLNK